MTHTCDFCDSPATHSQTETFRNAYGQQTQHTERQCDVHFAQFETQDEPQSWPGMGFEYTNDGA